MALTTAQQALLLFKKFLGLGQTTGSREFFSETLYPGRSAVYTNQIWTQADRIPTTAPAISSSVVSGVVQYWQDITLGAAPGTTTAFTSSLLIDAIPFNYGDGTSYNYTLKDSTNATIAFGQGDWIVDTDAGLVTFYSTVPSNMPPKISFYKYVGVKGFTSSSVSITGSFNGNLTGTSSFATNALTASYALNGGGSGVSSSYALTSSFAVTSSYANAISGYISFPSGLDVTGSLNVSGSITGSLLGTASWATNVISSSFATTASYATTAQNVLGSITSASYAATASLLLGSVQSASYAASASVATELIKQSITISSSISPAFTNITSGSQHLVDGVYSISSVLNSVSLTNYRVAGTFAWHTGSVSTTDTDELFLHRTGQSASSASIFMRTSAVSGSTTFLQIGSDLTLATGSYTFTLVKMI